VPVYCFQQGKTRAALQIPQLPDCLLYVFQGDCRKCVDEMPTSPLGVPCLATSSHHPFINLTIPCISSSASPSSTHLFSQRKGEVNSSPRDHSVNGWTPIPAESSSETLQGIAPAHAHQRTSLSSHPLTLSGSLVEVIGSTNWSGMCRTLPRWASHVETRL